MAFVSEMVDQLRDQLTDPADTQVTISAKRLYLNRAIARLWPGIYRVASTTIAIVAGVYDYSLPVAVADGYIISVELSVDDTDVEFNRFNEYEIIPGDEDLAGVFRMTRSTERLDSYTIRIRYAAPIPQITATTYTNMQSEAWTGPDRYLHLPVLYALSMCTMRKVDDRQDTYRYSTTQALNGVTDSDLLSAAQTWMGQFELELDAASRPLPIAKD